jgi:hypothetical protein
MRVETALHRAAGSCIHPCPIGCVLLGEALACTPGQYPAPAILPHTGVSGCREPLPFNSTTWWALELQSGSFAKVGLISRRALAGGWKGILDVVSNGRQESKDNPETDNSKGNENKDGLWERLLAGGIDHEAKMAGS